MFFRYHCAHCSHYCPARHITIRIQAPTVTIAKHLCSLACLRQWLGVPPAP